MFLMHRGLVLLLAIAAAVSAETPETPEAPVARFGGEIRVIVVEVPVSMRARQGGSPSLTVPRALLALARAVLAMMIVPLRSKVPGRRRA